eukprot:GHVP01027897.1.p1 GENE.GHVP01027897.1~~GHVP01027897.1.p1  ORF type:complete len:242 (+),score=5.12 GHVP01027897.1:55-780(+)
MWNCPSPIIRPQPNPPPQSLTHYTENHLRRHSHHFQPRHTHTISSGFKHPTHQVTRNQQTFAHYHSRLLNKIHSIRSRIPQLGNSDIYRPRHINTNISITPRRAFILRDKKGRKMAIGQQLHFIQKLLRHSQPHSSLRYHPHPSTCHGIYFLSIDLKSAFHQIPIDTTDPITTAFNGQTYQYLRLPMGIEPSAYILQSLLNLHLTPHFAYTRVYYDDITIFGSTIEDVKENATLVKNTLAN